MITRVNDDDALLIISDRGWMEEANRNNALSESCRIRLRIICLHLRLHAPRVVVGLAWLGLIYGPCHTSLLSIINIIPRRDTR